MADKIRSLCIAVSVALTTLFASTASAPYLFFGWNISEFQPDLVQGGRANTISVNPKSNDEILVASESGGLFRSMNRGLTWKHVEGLPEFFTSAVAFLPADPTIVIATAGEDTRVANGGGIWRSTDSGLNWKQMPGPSAPAGVTQRLSAFEISIAPDSGTIYVGTAYGVSISRDRGATWTHVDPFGSGDHRVLSVLGQSGNHVLAAGPAGIRRSKDGGATWLAPTTSTGTANVSDIHALGASPYENDQAYAVNWDTDLYFTEDGGAHWTRILSAEKGGGRYGGIAFVKAVAAPPPLRTVTLYEGNRCGISRLSAPAIAGSMHFDYSGTGTALDADHGDTRDLAFTSAPRQPLLLATDGGLHKTSDKGLHWAFTGGGHNGYNALQLTEVKGQWITALPRYDLYFGSQDTELWASHDEGVS